MQVTVVGGGFVGLVSSVCFCEFGHEVRLVDSDPEVLKRLRDEKFKLYGPVLDKTVHSLISSGRVTISGNLSDSCANSDAIILAVSTTTAKSDSDLTLLYDTIIMIASSIASDKYVGIFINLAFNVTFSCGILNEI